MHSEPDFNKVKFVPAVNFIGTMMANIDNENMNDADFRQFIRNTLSIVEKPRHQDIANADVAKRVMRYYHPNELDADARIDALRSDLDEYFKGTYIKEYRTEVKGAFVTLFPIDPVMDEDYEDNKMDEDIILIGTKHNFVVRWTHDVYTK